MFLKGSTSGYNQNDEQTARGPFLVLFDVKAGGELRCAVRHVSYHQLGNFMMGSCVLGDHYVTLSGQYGGDGLPRTPPDDLWPRLHPVPAEITEAYWKDKKSGLYEWANENRVTLSKLLPDPRPQPDWKFEAPYKRIVGPIRIPYVDDGYKRPIYVRQGDLVRYLSNGRVSVARIVCWAKRGDEPRRLCVLECSNDFTHGYERWCEPKDIIQLLSPNAFQSWFFGKHTFGPEVLKASEYGALSASFLANYLDMKGELVFPDSKWRQVTEHKWVKKAQGLTLEVDGYTARVSSQQRHVSNSGMRLDLRAWCEKIASEWKFTE